jgi:hypothetical protein
MYSNIHNSYHSSEPSKITFFNNHEALLHLVTDDDNFYNRFNALDLQARNCKNISEYKDMINESITDFTHQEMDVIKKLVSEISKLDWSQIHQKWVDVQNFNKLSWKLICTRGQKYEFGLPHTRGDVIIIPKNQIQDSKDFKNTLLHEQLHVYQKTHHKEFNKFLKAQGWKFYQSYSKCSQCRSNPDTNKIIYKKDGEKHVAHYNKNPSSIMDVTYFPVNQWKFEHPNEKYVVELLEKIVL